MLEPPACSRPARTRRARTRWRPGPASRSRRLAPKTSASPAPSRAKGDREAARRSIRDRRGPIRASYSYAYSYSRPLSRSTRSRRRPLRCRRRDTSTRTSRTRRTRSGYARGARIARKRSSRPRRWSRRPSAVPLGSTGSESSSTRHSRRRECPAVCAPRKTPARRFPDRSPPTPPRRRGERRRPRVATSRNRRTFDSIQTRGRSRRREARAVPRAGSRRRTRRRRRRRASVCRAP